MATTSSHWQGRRVFVTGCTGLIGKAAVRELLARGARVVGLVRDRMTEAEIRRDPLFRQVQILHGHVEDRFRVQSSLAIHNIQTVFHLAGPTDGLHPDQGTSVVLTAVRNYNPKLPVVAARPLPTLGLARASDDDRLSDPLPWGVAQFGEVFGGGDRKTFRIVPATIIGHITGDRSSPVTDAGPVRDFVHAADAGRACLTLAEALATQPAGQPLVVPFRSGWLYNDRDMSTLVRSVMTGSPLPSAAPIQRADHLFGWTPAKSLTDSLRDTADWYREFLQTWFFGTRSAGTSHREAA